MLLSNLTKRNIVCVCVCVFQKLIAASHQEMGLQLRGLSRYQTGGDPKRNSQGNGGVRTNTYQHKHRAGSGLNPFQYHNQYH